MKKVILFLSIYALFVSNCVSTMSNIPKSEAYKGFYNESPLTVLIMPPINNSNNVEAKEYFHSTLNIPIANSGYYVIPPFLSMEILRRESAYDSELFLQEPLQKFQEVFGADIAIFTIIHKWEKSGIASNVYVEIEYIFRSTVTNEILYNRRGNITYDASVSTGMTGLVGVLANLTASAINTAATKYVDVARGCNSYTLSDLPAGKYSPDYGTDGRDMSGKQEFSAKLQNKKSKY